MSYTLKPLALIPTAPAFAPGAHLVTVQNGADVKVPLSALPGSGFDVTAYGAVSGGVVECAAKIQDAIAACAGAGGGTVYFPPGIYLTESPVTVPAGVRLLGYYATIISSAPANGAKIIINGSNVIIEGLTLDGAKSGTSGSGTFDYGLIQMIRDNATALTGIKILKCTVRNSDGIGIRIVGNFDGVTVEGCKFSGNFIDIFAEKAGSYIYKNVRINGNEFNPTWFTSTFSAAVKMKGDVDTGIFASDVDVSDNVIRNSAEMGIELFGGFKDSSVVNNHIIGPIFGISINNGIGVTVALNKVFRCSYVGIEIAENSRHCLVIGNTVFQYASGTTRGGDAGIITSGTVGCSDNFFANNTVRGTNKAIDCQNTLRATFLGNRLYDSNVLIQVKKSSYVTVEANHLYAGTGATPTEFHIFVDFTNADCTDIDIVRNFLYGYANNDNLITYRGPTSWKLFNLRVAYNNLAAASFGNVSFNGGGVPDADRPNLQCYENYTFSRSRLTGVTGANAGDLMTASYHQMRTAHPVKFVSGTGFTGLTPDTRYFAIVPTAGTFQVATSYANAVNGTAQALSADGTAGIFDPSVGQAAWPDFTTNASAIPPFAASIQRGGISVAGKTTVAVSTNAAVRWVKLASIDFGNAVFLQAHFFAFNNSDGDSSAVSVIVSASPYGLGSRVTMLPNSPFTGIIDEVIANNPGSGSITEVWLKLKASPSKTWTIDCHFSDYPSHIIAAPTLTTTEPTWASNSSRANTEQYWRYRYNELSSSGNIDYGGFGAGTEQNTTVYVAGASTAGTPAVRVGWAAALPAGVIFKQARVTAADTVTITLYNASGSYASVGVIGTRVEVSQY